jgi:dCMP deaminase
MEKQTRPDWDLWFMRQAYVTAQRGSCLRLRVGALIVRDRDHRVISGGYNGAPRGMPDCLEVGCDLRPNLDGRESCFRTLHAESNALDLAGLVDHEPHTLYVTVTPCRNCALRIVQHGIKRVVYHKYYESQGTKEVEAIFAGTDPASLKHIHDGGMPLFPERAARVRLQHLDLPDEAVVPMFREITKLGA